MSGDRLHFWKMTGAGNDFIVLPLAPEALPGAPAAIVRALCRRGLSVGADGVLLITPAGRGSGADATLVHFNADGGRSDFCGNGSRCAARFAVRAGLAASPLRLATDSGILRAEVAGDRVSIEVPPPSTPVRRDLEIAGRRIAGWFVLAGVPHLVVPVEEPAAVDVAGLGAALRSHPALGAAGANVDFLGPERAGVRALRTFERGVEGETLACGSGAIAAAAILAQGGSASPIVLSPPSRSELTIDFESGPAGPGGFRLSGEARFVYEADLDPETLAGGSRV